jgi:hypothetical protein
VPDRRTDHNRWPVLDAALRLHMATTGAGDPVLEQAEMVEWLQYRVLSWTPGIPATASFDNAVLALLLATIQETR